MRTRQIIITQTIKCAQNKHNKPIVIKNSYPSIFTKVFHFLTKGFK